MAAPAAIATTRKRDQLTSEPNTATALQRCLFFVIAHPTPACAFLAGGADSTNRMVS